MECAHSLSSEVSLCPERRLERSQAGGGRDPYPAGEPFPQMGLTHTQLLSVRDRLEGGRSVLLSPETGQIASSDILSPHCYLFSSLCPWDRNDREGTRLSSVGWVWGWEIPLFQGHVNGIRWDEGSLPFGMCVLRSMLLAIRTEAGAAGS